MMLNSYTVALNLENLDSGLITLHQGTYKTYNDYEALGRAVANWLSRTTSIHSYKITVNTMGTGIDPGIAQLLEFIDNGRKIEAIKHYRQLTGLGLKESKEFVDKLEMNHNRSSASDVSMA